MNMPWGTIFATAIPIVEDAVKEIQKSTGKTLAESFADWLNHNIKGQPNAPALNGPTHQGTAPEAGK
jgi:hypothetical protein